MSRNSTGTHALLSQYTLECAFNLLLPGGNKKVTYLNKPAALSCRFV